MHNAEDPSLPEAIVPGGRDVPVERAFPAAGLAPHVGDHHFEHPAVAPVARPAAVTTPQW
jgi:hypothetical protein